MEFAAPLPRNLSGQMPVEEALEGRLSAEMPALRITLRRLAAGVAGLDPEDLLQDTMQRALRYRHAYDPSQALGAWLNGIALRVFLDHRARALRQPRALGEADVGVAAPAETRNGHPAPGLLGVELRGLLDALPEREREALERFHLRGQSVLDIAREMRAAEGTVKSWLHRARQRLAEHAREEDWL